MLPMLLRTLLPAFNPLLPILFASTLVPGVVLVGDVAPLLMFALGDVRGVVRVFIRGDVLPGLTLGVDLTVTCGVVVCATPTA